MNELFQLIRMEKFTGQIRVNPFLLSGPVYPDKLDGYKVSGNSGLFFFLTEIPAINAVYSGDQTPHYHSGFDPRVRHHLS